MGVGTGRRPCEVPAARRLPHVAPAVAQVLGLAVTLATAPLLDAGALQIVPVLVLVLLLTVILGGPGWRI